MSGEAAFVVTQTGCACSLEEKLAAHELMEEMQAELDW
jgi:hypothetical protein